MDSFPDFDTFFSLFAFFFLTKFQWFVYHLLFLYVTKKKVNGDIG